ncbi:MAG: hypothetical protein WBF06_14850 [Candidatus Acidiferrales bacterium]
MNGVRGAKDHGVARATERAALLLLFAFAGAAGARATTLARMTLGQLASAAQVIARVRCTGTASRREEGSIWTFTDFSVEEAFKGAPDAQLTIRLPGGRDGHLVETVEGAPRFAAGEDAIVFFERTRGGDWSISAWAEGTFRIARDPETRRETITQDSSGMAVFDPATRTFRAEGIARMPIAEFVTSLDAAIARGGR